MKTTTPGSALQSASGDSHREPRAPAPPRASVLLVDDQPARLLTYEAVLSGLEIRCVRALGGTEALQHLLEQEFAALLLDVQMPGMDGFELAKTIRQHPRLEKTPIIFVTGVHMSEFDRLRGYEVGAIDYISVPIVPEILRSKVAVLVELHLKRRELQALNRELADTQARLEQEHRQALSLKESELATERLRTAAALRARDQYDRALIEDAPVAIAHCALDGIFQRVNKAFCDLLGYRSDELRSLRWQDVTHPEDLEIDASLARQVLDGKLPHYTLQKRYLRKDGSIVWVNMFGNFLRDEAGHPAQGVAIAVDITEQIRSMQALRDSQERLLLAKRGARLGIFDWDLVTGSVSWDERLHELWGTGPEDTITFAAFMDGIHPDDREHARRSMDHAMSPSGDGQYACVHRIVDRRDRSIRWVEATGRVAFEDGRPVRFNGIVQDVTERKDAEKRLQLIADQLPVLISYVDTEGRYQFCNVSYCEWFGGSREAFIGRHASAVLGEDAYRERKHLIDRALGGELVAFEGQVPHRTLGVRHCDIVYVPHRHGNGKVHGVYVMAHDITERKRSEDALRESEARFRELADAMPQIVFTARPDGVTDYFNSKWYQMTGLPPGSTDDQVWSSRLHPDDRDNALRRWYESAQSGAPYQIEYRFNFPEHGGYRWHLTRALPVRNAAGEITRWYGTSTDIHDLRIAQEALRRADRRKDEFLATLAHELRNPLAPIRSAIQFLQLQSPADTRLAQASAIIDRQTEVMVRLVDDLLDLSRITRGRITLQTSPLQLQEVLSSAIEACRGAMEASRHELAVSAPAEAIFVNGDATRLAQVFSNLLNNAARYTQPSGRIEVTVRRQDHQVLVSVRDNGLGIPAAMLEAIFEMFTQVSSSIERSNGGLGIGLTLARQLAEMHGGRIEARSGGVGQGSEFLVTLPIIDSAQDASSPSPRAPPSGDRRRVLIADDNVDAARMLSFLLDMSGFEVRTAADGPEALRIFCEYQPEVALLDIGMLGMSGHEVASAIRALPTGKQVLLVAISGWGQESDRRAAFAAGFDRHLTKPVDFETLQATLLPTGRASAQADGG